MCGIIGYTGFREASAVVMECLQRLEYRGYDSAGLAVVGGQLHLFKKVGTIGDLAADVPDMQGGTAIGHTRWATHGEVTLANAHPHTDCRREIAVAHNGIIENFQKLRQELQRAGHTFASETDTEVVAHLIEDAYEGSLPQAVAAALKKIEGSYALVAVAREEPGLMVAARRESPLVVGMGDREQFVASDVPAFLPFTKRVIYVEDGDLVVVRPDSVQILDPAGRQADREECLITWDVEDAQKAGYEHFMLKEIHEQPISIAHTLRGRLSEIEPQVLLEEADLGETDSLAIVACGTSCYAGMVGAYIMEQLASIPVATALSSEYRYFGQKRGTVIGVTQSGETADTLGALRAAQRHGCRTMAITNVAGSTATRIADATILTRCGPEIGVAATKTFTSQVAVLVLLALKMGLSSGVLQTDAVRGYVSALRHLPSAVTRVLDREEHLRQVAQTLASSRYLFFIGRGIHHPLALEGALKMKEISYLHAEGFAAGELKHGPFALLTPETPVIALVDDDPVRDKMLTNIGEIKARKSPVIAVAPDHDAE
ncbi:MAG TPA: glutamine--fructose-6-phosphate transaminase (isomerizing), partial [Thermoplasmatales archaeon]|nr:glutamine--fructose-6-phosphate transaminase (isomerizing) [Thermoplasmatales archaeon]